MRSQTLKIAIGVSIGVVVGILIGCGVLIFMRFYRKRSQGRLHPKDVSSTTLPIHANGVHTSIESSASISVSHIDSGKVYMAKRNAHWNPQQNKDLFASLSAIPRYSYKYVYIYFNFFLFSLLSIVFNHLAFMLLISLFHPT